MSKTKAKEVKEEPIIVEPAFDEEPPSKVDIIVNEVAQQRNDALNQVVLLKEELVRTHYELRKAYARIAELLPPLTPTLGITDGEVS